MSWKALFLGLGLAAGAQAATWVAAPVSACDGPFTLSAGTMVGSGGFIYVPQPAGSFFLPGSTVYVDVDYEDLGGPGNLGLQYNAQSNDYQSTAFSFNTYVGSSGANKTAVFRIEYTNFDGSGTMCNAAVLRLTRTGSLQFRIRQVRFSDAPSASFNSEAGFLGPYTGPSFDGDAPVDTTALVGKMVVGYQGWFRTPGDDDMSGWRHYIPNWGAPMVVDDIAIDYWPDMDEATPAEKFAAPGFTDPRGGPAYLFSSDRWRTVLRHFQWMQTWGIDGVALQRNVDDLVNTDASALRNTVYVREAANRTGRGYYIEYALPLNNAWPYGTEALRRDWHYLVDTLRLTEDPRYFHQDGRPVVGIYGFLKEQISFANGTAVLDIFLNDPDPKYRAYVIGAGWWAWRISGANEWLPTDTSATISKADMYTLIQRMHAWQPWNAGNKMGADAKTDYWEGDKALLDSWGVAYQPELYPGGAAYNRSDRSQPPANYRQERLQGQFLWNQFRRARQIGAPLLFIGMFDEVDEGTQIFKVTNAVPNFTMVSPTRPVVDILDNEGLPSDCYLCFSGYGARLWKGQDPDSATKPDCTALSQASLPDPVAPLDGASLAAGSIAFSWMAAVPAQGSAFTVSGYELQLDAAVIPVTGLSSNQAVSGGAHRWRIRSVNTGGNRSAWSEWQDFSISGPTPSPTFAPSPTRTSSATPSPSPSRTVSRSPTRTPSSTLSKTVSASPSRTATASTTPSGTASNTGSPTCSATRTGSPSVTPTLTMPSSPSFTPTSTSSRTASPSRTATPSTSATLSFTASPMASETPTSTVTGSSSSSPSATPSPTPSMTRTSTPLPSPTLSVTRTNSPQPSATLTAPLPSPSLSPSATLAATAAPAPTAESGNAVVLEAVPFPQPNPRWVQVRLNRSAERVRLRVYTRAWVLVGESSAGPLAGGWNRLPLPDEYQGLAAGAYYFLADAGGQREHAHSGVLLRLH